MPPSEPILELPDPLPEEGAPIPLLLWCPGCGKRHVDRGEWKTRPHKTHACQFCGMCWRPAVPPTVGVQFLPGFQDENSGPLGS